MITSASGRSSGFSVGGILIFLVFYLVIIASILARTDPDIVSVFDVFAGKSSAVNVAAEQQFLLEAILPNLIGALIDNFIDSDYSVLIIWIISSILTLLISLLYLIREKSLDFKTILIIIFFSYFTKISVTWIGKSDLFTIAFLMVATFSKYRSIKIIASACAALCHPQIAFLALLFLEVTRYYAISKIESHNIVGVVAGTLMSKATIYYFISPDISGRLSYIIENKNEMLYSGLFDSASLFIVTITPIFIVFNLIKKNVIYNPISLINNKGLLLFGAIITIFLISCFLTFDRSRVFVLTTFPGYIFIIHLYREELYSLIKERAWLSSFIALLMLAMPQSDYTGWRGSSSVAKLVTRRLAPDVAARRFLCAPGCDQTSQNRSVIASPPLE